MYEDIRNLDKDKKLFLFFGLFLLLASLVVGYLIFDFNKTKKEFILNNQELEQVNSKLNNELSNLDKELEQVLSENHDMNALLTEQQRINLDLEEEKRNQEEEIEDLTKLTTIDPELLKKYSKVFFLSDNYEPRELVELDSKYVFPATKKIEVLSDIEEFLTDMLNDAEDDEILIRVASGFRSFDTQKGLKDAYTVQYGAGTANSFSAEQGYSEHQMGTTLDFTTPSLNGGLNGFDKTTAFTWLNENAYKYGFILSYPKNNGYYIYEPWHWRFVGRSLARFLHRQEKNFYEMDQRDIDRYLIRIFD